MKIITALADPILNNELKKINNFEVVAPDIQYQEGVLEILEEKYDIDILILSEILPGDFNIHELISKIKKENKKLRIIIILENKKEELENILISKGIFDIYYNNEITIDEIIKIINKENNKLIPQNNNKIIKYKVKRNNIIKNIKNNCIIISVIGNHECGKSIFCVNLSKNLKNKKILLIDFDNNIKSIQIILGIKKEINNKDKNINNIIFKFNKNIHIINDFNLLFQSKITNTEIKKILFELKNKYDYIIIDTSLDFSCDTTRLFLRNSDRCIFLSDANLLELKKSKELINLYIEKWYIKKENINIIFNKYNNNSIDMDLLKIIFNDFKILGKLEYNDKYNLLINKRFKNYFWYSKIKNEYKKIINNLNIKNLQEIY